MERPRTRRDRHAAVRLATLALAAALAARAAPAGAQVTPLLGRGDVAGSTIDWTALGPPFTLVPGSFSLAVGGNTVTVSNATGTDMERRDQVPCDFWDGNFASCEPLLWTNSSPGTGPLTFTFASPVTAFGTNVQADDPGPFLAYLALYDGSILLGTVARSGMSDNAGDGSAIFVGAGSTVPFDRAVLGLTTATVDPGDFAISGPAFGSTVPEPASVALLGLGLAGLGATRGLRRRASSRVKSAARPHLPVLAALALVAACHDASPPTAPGGRPAARVAASVAATQTSCPYDLATLQAWFEVASPAVLARSDGVFADVDEATTCLDFGVENSAAQAAAADTLADLGIPSNAYTIEIVGPITPAQAPTLRSRVRPAVGGLQIQFGPAGAGGGVAGTCTLGFNIAQGTRREFVTNDHCTDVRGAVTGTAFFQPVRVGMGGTSIGVEVVDPPFFTRGLFTNLRCPRGRQCRNSDAARVLYNAATASTVGRIARPDAVNNGSLVIDAARPEFSTVATAAGVKPALNTTLNKVGRTTGWTQGPVTRSCADVNVAGATITLLCQSQVRANVGGGDSGSPVFSIDDDVGNGTLYGILFASEVVAGVNHFWYSPFAAVQAELGF